MSGIKEQSSELVERLEYDGKAIEGYQKEEYKRQDEKSKVWNNILIPIPDKKLEHQFVDLDTVLNIYKRTRQRNIAFSTGYFGGGAFLIYLNSFFNESIVTLAGLISVLFGVATSVDYLRQCTVKKMRKEISGIIILFLVILS